MSGFTTAFDELVAVQNAEYGSARTALVGATTVPAVVSALDFDNVFMVGGIGENGGFDVQVKASALPSRPVKYSAVTVEGRKLSVLRVTDANGIYTITCGDPPQ